MEEQQPGHASAVWLRSCSSSHGAARDEATQVSDHRAGLAAAGMCQCQAMACHESRSGIPSPTPQPLPAQGKEVC